MKPPISARWDGEEHIRKNLTETVGIAQSNMDKKWADLSDVTKEKIMQVYYGEGHEHTVKEMDAILTTPLKKTPPTPPQLKKKKR